jgi:type II secretory pathway pseudopilin PulG
LIIVIIILGILASLAIPQFSASTDDAKKATLQGDLAVLRNAVNLYYHQHNSTYPGAVKEDGTGTATAGGDNPDAFINQLLLYTNADGETSATKDSVNYPYGPYLIAIPGNPLPIAGSTADSVSVTADLGSITADGSPTEGWKYSKETGRIIANNATYEAY